MMRVIVYAVGVCGLVVAACAEAATARGVVYEDGNGNGVRDGGEAGVGGVGVSNGVDVVVTDGEGRYEVGVTDDTGIFVIKPSGWNVRVDEIMVPRHYYLHKPEGSPRAMFKGVEPTGPLPASVDFPLYRNDESGPFEIVCFGDPQPRDMQEIYYTTHDVVEELIGYDGAFGVTLGDIVFDNLHELRAAAEHTAPIGVPWYFVIGNHDINKDAREQRLSDETYERVFGPSYFSFNYGEVHFIALNNIWWKPEEREYEGGLGEEQLKFIENDLKQVPADRLVVLFMHIPLVEVKDAPRLFELLKPYRKTFSVSAHWHRQRSYFMGSEYGWQGVEPHHHLVNATACGGWWTGWPDEYGIPHATMSDGAPNGYSFVRFEGTEYRVRFKAAGRPADLQMHVYAPDVVKAGEAGGTEVLVNVYAGTERSKVEMKFGKEGGWSALEQVEVEDPYYRATWERLMAVLYKIADERGLDRGNEEVMKGIEREMRPVTGRALPEPKETNHIWRGTLPGNPAPGVHTIQVRTVDMFGQEFDAARVIRVEE